MTYDFHPDARLEYAEAAGFYENRRPGLGASFTIEIEAHNSADFGNTRAFSSYGARCSDMPHTHIPLCYPLYGRGRIVADHCGDASEAKTRILARATAVRSGVRLRI